jgi:hypothetical protein
MDGLDNIGARLACVERQNRQLRFVMFATIALAGVALVLSLAPGRKVSTMKAGIVQTNRLEIANAQGKVWLTAGSIEHRAKSGNYVMDSIEIEDTFAGMGTTTIKGGLVELAGDTGSVVMYLPGGVDPEISIWSSRGGANGLLWSAPD